MRVGDWIAVGFGFWAVTALILSMVLEFNSGSKRIKWPTWARLFRADRYRGKAKRLYYVFVVWCITGPVIGFLGAAALVVKLILDRLAAIS